MRKRNVYITIFIISVFGLAYVQYQYLRVGLNLAQVQFNENMQDAITDIKKDLQTENELTYLLASAMNRDTSFFKTSPDSILDASNYFFNDFLNETMRQHGIGADFSYSLKTRDSSYYLNSNKRFNPDEVTIHYPVVLEGYLPTLFEKRFILDVKFTSLNRYFLSQLNGLTLPSLLFLLGIVAVVIWALRTYYWQRRVITTTDSFINNLTHELKTPVFSIGLASKLLNDKVDEDGENFVNIIRQQAERLSGHIEKVLELASMERKKSVIDFKEFDFYPNLLKLCQKFEALEAIEDVDFTYGLDGDSYKIMGESFHLENMVNNLLDNAKKYAVEPKIKLTASKEGKFLLIGIEDNGKGIAKEDRKKVFEKYYRGNAGNLHEVKGFGLGLNYVQTIVKKHKGNIKLDSELGVGTKITVILPLHEN